MQRLPGSSRAAREHDHTRLGCAGLARGTTHDGAFVPQSDHPRPECLESPVDTAPWRGRAMARFLSGEAPPKVLLRQKAGNHADQPIDVDEYKRGLIRKAGSVLEEDLLADWLGISLPELRRYTEAGDLIHRRPGRRFGLPGVSVEKPDDNPAHA